MKTLSVIPVELTNKDNNWCVVACVDGREITKKDKKLLDYLLKQKDLNCVDGYIFLDEFINVLKQNKTLYFEYKNFIEDAKEEQFAMQSLACEVFHLCNVIHRKGRKTKKNYMDKPMFDLIDYVCDRNTNNKLDVNTICKLAWGFIMNDIQNRMR